MPEQPYPAATLLEVENSLTGFFQDLGCRLIEYGPERVVVELLMLPRHLNNASNLHGGVTATLLDVAMGLCGTWVEQPEQRRVATTLSMNVNFSAPAPVGSRIRAVAVNRSTGHKVFMASCDLLDEEDRLLAFGEGVYKRGKLRNELS
ncbi:PaaI family thioesterase [Stutzerimonas stutzeri]|uniref:PaaI family thioesterase n=1 Tax=Stutzerimonas stutzeri TaxID=316 RepID=A0A2S4APX2_STUST|nr:PaaI family thioesterase [Stutzerimonas stutzeri]MCQ4263044.1 PaaI family thioesterase [Stutzerimonas stutzeri]POH83449.1 PaaI family thioesterase [Stutzerimonas stutzeri]